MAPDDLSAAWMTAVVWALTVTFLLPFQPWTSNS